MEMNLNDLLSKYQQQDCLLKILHYNEWGYDCLWETNHYDVRFLTESHRATCQESECLCRWLEWHVINFSAIHEKRTEDDTIISGLRIIIADNDIDTPIEYQEPIFNSFNEIAQRSTPQVDGKHVHKF